MSSSTNNRDDKTITTKTASDSDSDSVVSVPKRIREEETDPDIVKKTKTTSTRNDVFSSSSSSSNNSSSSDDSSSSSSSSSSASSSDDDNDDDDKENDENNNNKEKLTPGTYRYPDNTPILGPARCPKFFRRLMHESQWRHRRVDEFRFALRMFEGTLTRLMQEQKKQAESKGKPYEKFRWDNFGEIAEDFAVLCDAAVAVHALVPVDDRVGRRDFLYHLTRFFMQQMGISETMLTQSTLEQKVKDYEKGGTRYTSSAHKGSQTTNAMFASKDERYKKLQAFMTSNEKIRLKCSSKRVVVEDDGGTVTKKQKNDVQPPAAAAATPTTGGPAPPRVPAKVPMKSARLAPPSSTLRQSTSDAPTTTVIAPQPPPPPPPPPAIEVEQRNKLRVILGEGNTVLVASRMTMIVALVTLARNVKQQELRGQILHAIEGATECAIRDAVVAAGFLEIASVWLAESVMRGSKTEIVQLLSFILAFTSLPMAVCMQWIGFMSSVQQNMPSTMSEADGKAVLATLRRCNEHLTRLAQQHSRPLSTTEQQPSTTTTTTTTVMQSSDGSASTSTLLASSKLMASSAIGGERPMPTVVVAPSSSSLSSSALSSDVPSAPPSMETIIFPQRDPRQLLASLMTPTSATNQESNNNNNNDNNIEQQQQPRAVLVPSKVNTVEF
eukprot:PhM_4_TR311/c0_g1_i1/m.64415